MAKCWCNLLFIDVSVVCYNYYSIQKKLKRTRFWSDIDFLFKEWGSRAIHKSFCADFYVFKNYCFWMMEKFKFNEISFYWNEFSGRLNISFDYSFLSADRNCLIYNKNVLMVWIPCKISPLVLLCSFFHKFFENSFMFEILN